MPIPKEVLDRFNENRIFVETGTSNGKGVVNALNHLKFNHIYSIELDKDLHEEAVKKFNGAEFTHRIKILHGKSSEVLPQLIDKHDEDYTFFLDAHWDGEDSLSANPNQPNLEIILEELECIRKSKSKSHTIIIDDMKDEMHLPIKKFILENINSLYDFCTLDLYHGFKRKILKGHVLVCYIPIEKENGEWDYLLM